MHAARHAVLVNLAAALVGVALLAVVLLRQGGVQVAAAVALDVVAVTHAA